MLQTLITALVGILGGLGVGVQGPIANAISSKVGGAASSLIVHVSGAVISVMVLLVRGGEQVGNWREIPWYMWFVGAFGVLLYLTISYTMPRLGATAALAMIIIGQLTAGIIIDQFGLFGLAVRPIDSTRIVAALLLLAGAYLILR